MPIAELPLSALPSVRRARRHARDGALALGATALLAVLMSVRGDVVNPRGDDPARPLGHYAALWHSGHVPGGALLGLGLVLAAALGVLGLLGDSPLDLRGDEATVAPAASMAPPPRAWWRAEGTWLVAFCAVLYLPVAGAYGFWDPWETHYAEVAREVLARDDWITLWWGQEGWFMSKPVLLFWLAALGMDAGSAAGLSFWPDAGPGAHEWCVRAPIVLLAIGAVYALYRAVASAWGRRAGLLCGCVLATTPHWFFLAHQAMTDMPFLAPLVAAMAFLMLAVTADPEARVVPRAVRIAGRTLRWSAWHLCVGALVLVALPQVVYLLTRPVMLACPDAADRACHAALAAAHVGGVQLPIERFFYGSAGNSVPDDLAASVPGSPAWEPRYNSIPGLVSCVQGGAWLALGVGLLVSLRRERRRQALCFAGMYLCSALSFLGKGPAGLGVPEAVLLGFVVVTGRWRLLLRLRLAQGVAIFLLCGLPWYVAVYARLGQDYIDRFVVNDLLNRAFAGVHGDTGTLRYFVGQLGYGLFPWTGLVPAALAGWRVVVPPTATPAQRDVARLALLWFLATFTLFSLMVTKFHHYIAPAVPAAALLVGLLLHQLLGAPVAGVRRRAGITAALVVGTAALVVGVASFVGPWRGHAATGSAPVLGAVLSALGLGALGLAWRLAEGSGTAPGLAGAAPAGGAHAAGALGLAGAVVLGLITVDLAAVAPAHPTGSQRFVQLFTYNYNRAFPSGTYDYRAVLVGFGAVAVAAAALMAVGRARAHAARMMLALAACLTAWALDLYIPDLSHHWSQRGLFERYYALRRARAPGAAERGDSEDGRYVADPIAAYELNWKGENFYTGNHAATLECGLPLCAGTTTRAWLARHQGQRAFFVTEHARAAGLIRLIEQGHGRAQALTNAGDNVMFVLIEGWL